MNQRQTAANAANSTADFPKFSSNQTPAQIANSSTAPSVPQNLHKNKAMQNSIINQARMVYGRGYNYLIDGCFDPEMLMKGDFILVNTNNIKTETRWQRALNKLHVNSMVKIGSMIDPDHLNGFSKILFKTLTVSKQVHQTDKEFIVTVWDLNDGQHRLEEIKDNPDFIFPDGNRYALCQYNGTLPEIGLVKYFLAIGKAIRNLKSTEIFLFRHRSGDPAVVAIYNSAKRHGFEVVVGSRQNTNKQNVKFNEIGCAHFLDLIMKRAIVRYKSVSAAETFLDRIFNVMQSIGYQDARVVNEDTVRGIEQFLLHVDANSKSNQGCSAYNEATLINAIKNTSAKTLFNYVAKFTVNSSLRHQFEPTSRAIGEAYNRYVGGKNSINAINLPAPKTQMVKL